MSIEIDQVQEMDNKTIAEPVQNTAKTSQNEPGKDFESNEYQNTTDEINPELDQELQVKLQPILLDSAINALGNTLEKLTSNEDINFTEDERKALVDCWTPLLPSVSPLTNAILVTVIILSGKALLYTASKRKLKASDTKALPVNSEAVKEAID
jgi:hypothetical protein